MKEIFDFLEQHSELVEDCDLDGLIREFEKTKLPDASLFRNTKNDISLLIALLIEADIPEFREKMFLNYDQATNTVEVSFNVQSLIELISAKGWMSSSSAYDTNHFILHVLEKEDKDQIKTWTCENNRLEYSPYYDETNTVSRLNFLRKWLDSSNLKVKAHAIQTPVEDDIVEALMNLDINIHDIISTRPTAPETLSPQAKKFKDTGLLNLFYNTLRDQLIDDTVQTSMEITTWKLENYINGAFQIEPEWKVSNSILNGDKITFNIPFSLILDEYENKSFYKYIKKYPYAFKVSFETINKKDVAKTISYELINYLSDILRNFIHDSVISHATYQTLYSLNFITYDVDYVKFNNRLRNEFRKAGIL